MRHGTSDAILDRLLALHPKIIDLVLDRVWRLLAAMGHPERALPPVVHIAGTNGKGSTLAMIRAGLEADGAAVHAYTSPHLVRFHERIRLAGQLIDEDALAALLGECEQANAGAPITYFEITTVAAIAAFARQPADWTLLEVGLGGRLDATNVVTDPALTVITPVSLDHQQYLGETLPEIAAEKAGILKPGVPCIVADQAPEALEVIERTAARVGAPLVVAAQNWTVGIEDGRLVYRDADGLLDLDPPRLAGAHQVANAGAAIAALRVLGLGEAACQAAVTGAVWPARLQRLGHGPLVDRLGGGWTLWLDGGHNAAAGAALAEAVAGWPGPVHAVIGMLDTKRAGDFLRPLAPHLASVQTVAIPGAAATLSAEALAGIAADAGIAAQPAETVEAAMAALGPGTGGQVLICGSLYLAGHVLEANG